MTVFGAQIEAGVINGTYKTIQVFLFPSQKSFVTIKYTEIEKGKQAVFLANMAQAPTFC